MAVILVAGVLGSLAQWWRRRRPELAGLVGSAAYGLSGNPGPLLIGLYSGAVYAPRRGQLDEHGRLVPQGHATHEDDQLEIPAFLRRQAN